MTNLCDKLYLKYEFIAKINEDFVKEYKDDGKSFGIDVSAWQDDIDYEAVKKAGCEFVIIRIGWSDEGKVTPDNWFDNNFKKAKAAAESIINHSKTAVCRIHHADYIKVIRHREREAVVC